MATEENQPNDGLAVVRGVLEARPDAVSSLPLLPATRSLTPADRARVDREEGLSALAASGAGGNPAGRKRSVGELLWVVGALLLIVLACLQILPLGRIFRLKPKAAVESFATAVAASPLDRSPRVARASVENVLDEVKALTAKSRYREAIEVCRKALATAGETREAVRAWERVWAVYFEALERVGRRREMFAECMNLAKIDPDADVVAYYRARHWLGEIAAYEAPMRMDAGVRAMYARQLRAARRACELRLEGKREDARVRQFALLVGELRLGMWILSGRQTNPDGQREFTAVLDAVKDLPEDEGRVRFTLRAWQELQRAYRAQYMFSWSTLSIRGEDVNGAEIERRIRVLEEKLARGGAK